MSLLPISQSDLELCAQRWGWEYLEPRYSSPRIEAVVNGNLVRLLPDRNDWTNAAAILDRENWLLSKKFRFCMNVPGESAWVEDRDYNTLGLVAFPPNGLEVPNFRSWLLVQLTLQLPPEVWK